MSRGGGGLRRDQRDPKDAKDEQRERLRFRSALSRATAFRPRLLLLAAVAGAVGAVVGDHGGHAAVPGELVGDDGPALRRGLEREGGAVEFPLEGIVLFLVPGETGDAGLET